MLKGANAPLSVGRCENRHHHGADSSGRVLTTEDSYRDSAYRVTELVARLDFSANFQVSGRSSRGKSFILRLFAQSPEAVIGVAMPETSWSKVGASACQTRRNIWPWFLPRDGASGNVYER